MPTHVPAQADEDTRRRHAPVSIKGDRPNVSVVVPVYRGVATIDELARRLTAALSGSQLTFEIIFVNDGSPDASWSVIQELVRSQDSIVGVNLMRNYGQHNALLAGIMRTRGDVIVTIDDDLQHPPEELPKLFERLRQGCDLVYGKPAQREHKAWRNLGSRIVKSGLRVALGADMAEMSSSFRVFRSELKRGFAHFSDAQVSIDVLLSWTASRVACVTVEHHGRRHGRSTYSFRKLVSLTMSMVTGYSSLPLRIASTLGLLSASLGLLLFVYVVIKRLTQTDYVPGFAFLAASIALFSGLQLFTLGVVGEYLARVHFRTMGKPAYVVREQIEHGEPPGRDD